MIAVILFFLTIPLANWLIGNVGVVCVPQGPCLLPVFPGLMAPSGVLVIGVALVLRDLVHERYGAMAVFIIILCGAIISFGFAPAQLALASGAAFLLSELADLFVYAPLRKRRLALAVLLSGVVGAIVDSAVFLWLAFGSLDYIAGQAVGKLYASLLFAIYLYIRFGREGRERPFGRSF